MNSTDTRKTKRPEGDDDTGESPFKKQKVQSKAKDMLEEAGFDLATFDRHMVSSKVGPSSGQL